MRITLAFALSVVFVASAVSQNTALTHIITVPATTDSNANGSALLTALAGITGQSVTQPYVVQLDAGTYTVPTTLVLNPFVSLKGAGMTSTTIVAGPRLRTTMNIQNQVSPTPRVVSSQSLSSVSVVGPQALAATILGYVVLNQVQLTSLSSDFLSTLTLIATNSHFTASNSILGILRVNGAIAAGTPTSFVSAIVGSEVELVTPVNVPMVCLADYSYTGTVVSPTCQ